MKQPPYAEFLAQFPCFAEREIETVDQVIEFARSAAVTSGTLAAARFALAVWNPGASYDGIGKFSMYDVPCWDERYREIFARWAAAPFWY